MPKMRDTEYATEQCTTRVGDNRIERLFIKAHKQVEIRVSWWPVPAKNSVWRESRMLLFERRLGSVEGRGHAAGVR
jgi:hypothetical protein